jgi:hypothetical protein
MEGTVPSYIILLLICFSLICSLAGQCAAVGTLCVSALF